MTEEKPPRPKQPPPLVIPPELEPVYANLVRIAHTPSEMVFDFARLLPGTRSIPVLSRVMMSPLSAKLFARALAENIARYETSFGEIRVPGDQALADYSKLFRPPEPPETPEE